MDNQTEAPLADLRAISAAVEQLVAQLQALKGENEVLKQRMDTLLAEKSQLMQKNDQARTRLEAMINRLKMLEQSA
jgi:cell division protein ZapB